MYGLKVYITPEDVMDNLIQKAMDDDDYWTAEKVEVLEELLKREVQV